MLDLLSEFFINRPIFAGVISIIITLAGLIASQVLPIAQYPEIAPPTVTITANYTGASADTLAENRRRADRGTALRRREPHLFQFELGVDNGTLTITCTFAVGADGDKAISTSTTAWPIALPRLPDVVRRSGVIAQKRSTDILLLSPGLERPALRHAVTCATTRPSTSSTISSAFRASPTRTIFGARDYSMRIWLRPRQDGAAGRHANRRRQTPSPRRTTSTRAARSGRTRRRDGQAIVYTVTARGRLMRRMISATSSCVRADRTARCASATSRASNSVR